MKYRKLGRTELDISVIGLGTMTWGFQNTQVQGFEQMDYALERGINFLALPLIEWVTFIVSPHQDKDLALQDESKLH